MKVLIIDDLALVRRQIKNILERKFDFEIVEFIDSHSALEEIRCNNSIDLIITELAMSDINGMQFALEVRKIFASDGEGSRTPPEMILLSATNPINCGVHGKGSDCDLLNLAMRSCYFEGILFKPIHGEKLEHCISKIISTKTISSKDSAQNLEVV